MRRLSVAVLVFFVVGARLSLISCFAQSDLLPAASLDAVGMSANLSKRVDEAMNQSIDEEAFVGGIVMIARNGKVVLHRAYGLRDRASGAEMTPNTIVRIYSMTKAITTAAALILVDEGKLHVDDPVSKYISDFEQSMKIADLMRHTSGLSYGRTKNTAHDKAVKKLGMEEGEKSLSDMETQFAEIPLLFKPGTDWVYGISTDVLGRVVEIVSGMTLEDFFQKRIFGPLGMVDTGFTVPTAKRDRFAEIYRRNKQGKLVVDNTPRQSRYLDEPKFLSGGGGLVSTASDYMRFLMMIEANGSFRGKQILKPQTVQLMITNQLPEQSGWVTFGDEIRKGVGFGFGFNVRVSMSDWDPQGRVGEYGWGGAASTHYWVSPEDRLIVVTLEQVMPYQWHTENLLKGLIYDAIED